MARRPARSRGYAVVNPSKAVIPVRPVVGKPGPGGGTPSTPVVSGTLTAATVGTSPAFTPTISGGTAPYALSLASGTLPPGRSISGTSVTGSYTTAGSYSYVLRVTDAAGATATLAVGPVVVSANGGADVPVASGNPTITGGANEGDLLTITPPSFSPAADSLKIVVRRDGVAVLRLAGLTYHRRGADVGKTLTFDVQGVNAAGAGTAASVAAPTTVAAAPFSFDQLVAAGGAGSVVDFDPAQNVTADGANKVSGFAAKRGTGSFAQATAANQPVVVADGWAAGVPVIRLTSGSAFQSLASADATQFALQGDFIVVKRAAAQYSVNASKVWFEWGRPTDNLRSQIASTSPTLDAPEGNISMSGIGGSTSISITDFFPNQAIVMTSRGQANNRRGGFRGENPPRVSGSSTSTTTKQLIGGDTVNTGVRMDFVRHVRVNLDVMPGGVGQSWVPRLAEGVLSWRYGKAGDTTGLDLVAQLPASHPFKTRAPTALDFLAKVISIQTWGNSITNGFSGPLGAQMGYNDDYGGMTGASCSNGGKGGDSGNQILDRFLQGTDLGNSGTSGLSLPRQREKVTVIGDLYTNGIGAATGSASAATVFDAISQMVAACETAQGVSAGQGRIVVLGRYRTTSSGFGGDASTDAVKVADAQLKAAFPNYFYQPMDYITTLSAADGPYPDADIYAKQAWPTVLRSDTTHPTTEGYVQYATGIASFIRSKGWDRA